MNGSLLFRGGAATMANLIAMQGLGHHVATQVIISTGRKKTPYADNPETAFPGIVVLSETSIPNTGVVSLILDICRRLADVHASSEELLSNSSKADVEHWSEKRKLGVSHKDVPPHDFNNFIQLNLKGKKPIIFERREVYKTSLITLMRTLRALGLNAKVSMNPVDGLFGLSVSGDIDTVRNILNTPK